MDDASQHPPQNPFQLGRERRQDEDRSAYAEKDCGLLKAGAPLIETERSNENEHRKVEQVQREGEIAEPTAEADQSRGNGVSALEAFDQQRRKRKEDPELDCPNDHVAVDFSRPQLDPDERAAKHGVGARKLSAHDFSERVCEPSSTVCEEVR
jgi:hypothetical protein